MQNRNLLAANDRQRLIHLCGMTGSDHDGEALNAVRLANRHLRTVKATWADALEVHPAPPAPPPPKNRTYGYIPHDWPARWRWVACAILDSGCHLSGSDSGLLRRITVYRCYRPTTEQLCHLRAIADRVLARAAA